MSLFFVYKLSLKKNAVKIVGHATSDESALKLLKLEADKYATKKSRKQFDQTEPTSYVTEGIHVTYAIRESRKNVNTVDVYKTEIITKSGWGWRSSNVKTDQSKIAQFSIARYEQNVLCKACDTNINSNIVSAVNPLQNIKSQDYTQQNKVTMVIDSRDRAYRQLLPELRKSEVFRNRKKIVEEASNLPPIMIEVEGLNTV